MKINIHLFAQQDFTSMEECKFQQSATVRDIPLTEGMSLYMALQKAKIAFSAPCSGTGICGACKIKLIEGNLEITKKDRRLLSDEELKEGFRLACQAYPVSSCSIMIPGEELVAVTDYRIMEKPLLQSVSERSEEQVYLLKEKEELLIGSQKSEELTEKKKYGVAIDLGTTTLAYELFEVGSGTTVRTKSSVNPQRIYGSDVITRMEESDNGRREILKQVLPTVIDGYK